MIQVLPQMMDHCAEIQRWYLDRAHQHIIDGLQKARAANMSVPNDPPLFGGLNDMQNFKQQCINMNTKELGTLCYLNDLCDIEMNRVRFKY